MRSHKRGLVSRQLLPHTHPPPFTDTISVPQRLDFPSFSVCSSRQPALRRGPFTNARDYRKFVGGIARFPRERERERERRGIVSRSKRNNAPRIDDLEQLGSVIFLFFSLSLSLPFPSSLAPFIFISRWNHGWMDGWMDGWMEKQRNRRDIPLFANSIDHDS